MKHYLIEVAVNDDAVKIVKEQLADYVELSGGFAIMIEPKNDVTPPDAELTNAIIHVFMQLMAILVKGKFEGIH